MSLEYKDLGLLIDSKVPLIIIESIEEPRVLDMITRLCVHKALRLFAWSVTEGLNQLGFGDSISAKADTADPELVLREIKSTQSPALYVLCDYHPYLKDAATNTRLMREIAMRYSSLGHTLILLSHKINLPPELKRYAARFELSMPSEEQLTNIVREEANHWSQQNNGQPVRSDTATFRALVNNLKGMPLMDARHLVKRAIVDDGAILDADLPEVNKAKFKLMDMDGVLSFEYNTTRMNEVAGLDHLKAWLTDRSQIFRESPVDDTDIPKGIMLLGVQGSGKSLAAKAVAGAWGIPLLRLDFGSLYNKFYGETERNLRDALQLADTMEPCVLWLDEIEKGVSISSSDDGISKRLLGTLLTWMAERNSRVFLVATSNDITALPPELVRKGRMDEIFFVDLPDQTTRMEIFRIHLQKRIQLNENFELKRLAILSDGFSGAEIEQVIVAARYTASAQDTELAMTHLVEAIASTNPLSIVMSEQITALRQWAKGRTVEAG